MQLDSKEISTPAGRPKVSLTMIVRNEEVNLPVCLRSTRGLVDEMIIIDTGSQDSTREVARSLGATVVEVAWSDSFAAARNEGLWRATGDWIFCLDADECLDDENRERLRVLLASLGTEKIAYTAHCVSPSLKTRRGSTGERVHLFRNVPGLAWEYRVHEQILPSLLRAGAEVRSSGVTITHSGYADPAVRRRKLERDLRLSLLELPERPGDRFTLFNLGGACLEMGRPEEALPYLQRSLATAQPADSTLRALYFRLAECQRQLGRTAEALATCSAGRQLFSRDAELLSVEGAIRLGFQDWIGAERCYRQLLAEGEIGPLSIVANGVRDYLARHHLAAVLWKSGRPADAEGEWRACLATRPDFLPAHIGLSETLAKQERWEEFEEHAKRMAALGSQGELTAATLRGRTLLRRELFNEAFSHLDSASLRFPKDLSLRVLLSQAALIANREKEAEAALIAVLELDPNHAEAKHNLAVLRSRSRL
jgi:tetratricopeptide (TPR) repeat protein